MDRLNKEWKRIEYKSTPLYVRPEVPDWFVPNKRGDQLLSEWLKKGEITSRELEKLLLRINGKANGKYLHRTEKLTLSNLKECWIHITNRCNMECRHCMFKSSPKEKEELSGDTCSMIIKSALAQGTEIFFFTGGEPFLSKAFFKSVEEILNEENTHVVVLTNLSLISSHKKWLKQFPKDRLHFQISLDGLEENHNFIRGKNAFKNLSKNLDHLNELGFPATLSTTITKKNVEEMEEIVSFAAEKKISNLHYLWLFQKGNADQSLYADPDTIFENLKKAQIKAEQKNIKIDNIEIIRSQVFSSPGTQYNLSNAGWQSIAIGPDGFIYPTPALIYTEEMKCGHIDSGLEEVFRNSTVLKEIRKESLNNSEKYSKNPMKFLIGGGDIDHSFINGGQIVGHDPYVELYNNIAKWLISENKGSSNLNGHSGFRLKMGEIQGDCPKGDEEIFFTHSNCVLSLPGGDTHSQVNHFYTEAAKETKEDILNPVCYDEHLISHIPSEFRYRSYGCGSPVLEADVRNNEVVVDLGSGTGIECFIASRLSGPEGKVIGIDMGDTMLGIAENTKKEVVADLKFDNLSFRKAFLEKLPIEDQSVDIVISNCVVNLSPNKRQVFEEVFRILKPGGRLFISDITYCDEIPLSIKYNETLRGECIGGALSYHDLFGLLNDTGFTESNIQKAYLYREVKGFKFYSITYSAYKPETDKSQVMYDFPEFNKIFEEVESEPSCACFIPPDNDITEDNITERHSSGCMVCGEDLNYENTEENAECHFCGETFKANGICKKGHFVCDTCHSKDAISFMKQVLLNSRDDDAVFLMQKVRGHLEFPVHGPEHHSLLPAVILTALRNSGENVRDEDILTAIERGQTIAGGACAFFGACGAAIGAGIAVSALTGATPLDGEKRQLAQLGTMDALSEIASYDAPRCCQRDLYLALKSTTKFLGEKMGIKLKTDYKFECSQFSKNKECIFKECPLWPENKTTQI